MVWAIANKSLDFERQYVEPDVRSLNMKKVWEKDEELGRPTSNTENSPSSLSSNGEQF